VGQANKQTKGQEL